MGRCNSLHPLVSSRLGWSLQAKLFSPILLSSATLLLNKPSSPPHLPHSMVLIPVYRQQRAAFSPRGWIMADVQCELASHSWWCHILIWLCWCCCLPRSASLPFQYSLPKMVSKVDVDLLWLYVLHLHGLITLLVSVWPIPVTLSPQFCHDSPSGLSSVISLFILLPAQLLVNVVICQIKNPTGSKWGEGEMGNSISLWKWSE